MLMEIKSAPDCTAQSIPAATFWSMPLPSSPNTLPISKRHCGATPTTAVPRFRAPIVPAV